jgi:hypothetical protein
MWRCMALVRTDVSEERIAMNRVKRISELVTDNIAPSSPILITLGMGSHTFLRNVSSYNSHIPEDDILHSHRRENFKFYTKKIKIVRAAFGNIANSGSSALLSAHIFLDGTSIFAGNRLRTTKCEQNTSKCLGSGVIHTPHAEQSAFRTTAS